jgi:hypothetical protein
VKHQQDESVTWIQTPFGSLTLIASTTDRITISTGCYFGRRRERLLRVRGRSVRAEFDLRLRAGAWKVIDHSLFRVLFETADGHAIPAATRALIIRVIIPIATEWAAAHSDVLLRAEEETFQANHNGLLRELPELAEDLEGQAQMLAWNVEFRVLAGADRGLYKRMERISAAFRVVAAHVAALTQDIQNTKYQAGNAIKCQAAA